MFQSALRYLRKIFFASDTSPGSSGDRIFTYMIGSDNLTALAAFCNTLFDYLRLVKSSQIKRNQLRRLAMLVFNLSGRARHWELWLSTATGSVASALAGRANMATD